MYKIYRKAAGSRVERSPNEFFETKESERIVFDIHLVAHFRSILFLGNQNRFREIQKTKKKKHNTEKENKNQWKKKVIILSSLPCLRFSLN